MFLRLDPAARSFGSRRRQPDDSQIADGAATNRWPTLGVGRLRRQRGLLSWLVHSRLELRTGNSALVSGARTHAAGDRIWCLPKRSRPPAISQLASDSTSSPR